MMNDQNPYAAPQTVDTREVSPPAPRARENRNYWWLKRGLASLAIVLSPLTIFVVGVFQDYAVLGLSVILPICCGMLAVVPPRTPGKIFLLLAVLAQAVGCFCLFALVFTMPEGDKLIRRFDNLMTIAFMAEVVFHVSLMAALIRLGHWLQDRWLCRICYCSMGCSGLYFLTVLYLRLFDSSWRGWENALGENVFFIVLIYLTFFAALILGLRIPRLVSARIPNPPRFEKRDLEQPVTRVP